MNEFGFAELRITHSYFQSDKIAKITRVFTPDSDPREISNLQKDLKKDGIELSIYDDKSFKISESIWDPIIDPVIEKGKAVIGGLAAWGFYKLSKFTDEAIDAGVELWQVFEDGFEEAGKAFTFSGYTGIPLNTFQKDAVTIDYADPSLSDLLGTRPFPGQTENEIVVDIFTTPEIDSLDDFIFTFPEDTGVVLPTTTEFPLRDKTLEAILEGPFVLPVEEEDPLGSYFYAAGTEGNIIGTLREQRVAEITGGTLAKDSNGQDIKLFEPGVSEAVAIDVFGPNGELILVGGPKKAENRSVLGQRVKDLKIVAEARGVKAQYYFSDNTPQSAIEFVKKEKRLGAENVFTFPEVTLP